MNGEYLPALDVRIVCTDKLPTAIHAFVTPDAHGGYTVVVNSRLDPAAMRAAVAHELRHITNDHLHSCLPVHLLEADTHD